MSLLPVPCRLKGLRSRAKLVQSWKSACWGSVLYSFLPCSPFHTTFFHPLFFFINPFCSVLATFFLKNFPSLLFSLFTSELVLLPFLPSYQSKRLIRVIIRQNKDKFVQIFPSWLRWTKCIFISDHWATVFTPCIHTDQGVHHSVSFLPLSLFFLWHLIGLFSLGDSDVLSGYSQVSTPLSAADVWAAVLVQLVVQKCTSHQRLSQGPPALFTLSKSTYTKRWTK